MTKAEIAEQEIEAFTWMKKQGYDRRASKDISPILVKYLNEKQCNMHVVGVTLPSDKEIDLEVLDIIDKNLQCGTGQEEGILCNRFATTSFIRNYIKKIVGN
jgi:hypothetical protein